MKTNSEGPVCGSPVQRKRGAQLQLSDLPMVRMRRQTQVQCRVVVGQHIHMSI
jgi:hypothetical protein